MKNCYTNDICRFNEEVCWAFRLFDIDNSGSIAVAEIHESVEVECSAEQSLQRNVDQPLQAVWAILDGLGEGPPGSAVDTATFLQQRLRASGVGEVNDKLVLCIRIYSSSSLFLYWRKNKGISVHPGANNDKTPLKHY